MSSVVIQTAWFGDVVLTLPLIRRVASHHGPVDVVVTPGAAPLLAGQPTVRDVVPYDKRGADRGLTGFRRLVGRLRARGYARAFLPHRSLRSSLLARQARIPERIGFTGGLAGLLHTSARPRPERGHESQRLAALLPSADGLEPPWLTLAPEDRAAARAWLARAGITGRYIVLAPGARWATKRWPGFAALAPDLPLPPVLIGGPEDRPIGEAIAAGAPQARSAAGHLSLLQSAALIDGSALLVTNDSVALHLAVALARPVVAVAGPTGPAPGFEPPPAAGVVLAHPALACRPCSPHGHARCPLGHHRCMRELDPVRVLDAVRRLLDPATAHEGRPRSPQPQ